MSTQSQVPGKAITITVKVPPGVTNVRIRIVCPTLGTTRHRRVQRIRNTALNLHRLRGATNIGEACRVTAFSADRGLNLLENPQNTRSHAC